jgi:hypothetical protein
MSDFRVIPHNLSQGTYEIPHYGQSVPELRLEPGISATESNNSTATLGSCLIGKRLIFSGFMLV